MLQHLGHLTQRVGSWEETLVLAKIEGKKSRRWQRGRRLAGIIDSVGVDLSKLWEMGVRRGAWHAAVHGVTESDTSQ